MSRDSMLYDEWSSALSDAMVKSGDDGMTCMEIVEATGSTLTFVKRGLVHMKKAGRLVVGRSQREALDGYLRSVPVYRILPETAEQEG